MKRWSRWVLWLVVARPLWAGPAVANGGFEDGRDGPTGWQVSTSEGGQGDWVWSPDRAHTGQRALTVRKTNAGGYSLVTGPMVEVASDRDYEVRCSVQVRRPSKAAIYFMLSQYKAADAPWDLPNAFGAVRPYYSGDGWVTLATPVHIRPGNTRLRIQIVIARAPVEVTFDDVAVVELKPGAASYRPRYEKPVAEPLPPLEAAKAAVARRQPVTARVELRGERPRFVIGDQVTPACFYVGPFHNPYLAQVADFRRAGVRVYLVPLVLGAGVYGHGCPWLGPNRYDFSKVEDLVWRVLRVDPEGQILFYFGTDPYRDWGAEHPDDVACDQNGAKAVVAMHPIDYGREPRKGERYGPSLVSAALRKETGAAIRELLRFMARSDAGRAVIGYHVAGLNDGQFFAWAKPGHVMDYCPASQQAFRRWLRERYGDEPALRQAWRQPQATFETAAIPAGERRLAPGFWRSAPDQQDIADYRRFYSEGTVDTIAHYAGIIKEESGGRLLVGTYWEDMPAAVDSHYALGRLLRCRDVDYLSGPTAYGVRMPGEHGAPHSTWGSVALHQRIWLAEQDLRSWLSGAVGEEYDRSVGRAPTAADHNAMVRRESGMTLAAGHGTWWYDMDGGWFRDDGIMAGVAEARAAFARDLACAARPRADVAVFSDEQSFDYVAEPQMGRVSYEAVVRQVHHLNTSGVPYHHYLLDDVANPKLPDYRLYVFVASYHLRPAVRRAINALKRDGKTLVFVHAPGVIGAADPAAAIGEVTNLKVRALPGDTLLAPLPPAATSPLGTLGTLSICGLSGPAFAVDDPAAAPIGVTAAGVPVAAIKEQGTWRAVYFGGLGLSDELANRLARLAGAWVAAEPGDAVYANQHIATIHALYDGDKVVTLAGPSRVEDLTSHRVLAERATEIRLAMKRGETRWFALTP